MPVSCVSCGKRAQMKRPKTGDALCKECFFWAFEAEVHWTITTGQLLQKGELVAVAASGGKDSTVLAYVLKLLNERHKYGVDLVLLSIDEGITGYRDDSLEESMMSFKGSRRVHPKRNFIYSQHTLGPQVSPCHVGSPCSNCLNSNSILDVENISANDELHLYKALRPFLIFLAPFCLYIPYSMQSAVGERSSQLKSRKTLFFSCLTLWKLYSVCVFIFLCVCLLTFVKSLILHFVNLDGDVATVIVYALYAFNVSVNVVCFRRLWLRKDGVWRTISLWGNITKCENERTILKRHARRVSICALAVGALVISASVTANYFLLLNGSYPGFELLFEVDLGYVGKFSYFWCWYALCPIMMGLWVLPPGFFAVLCLVASQNFKMVCSNLARAVELLQSSNGEILFEVEQYRKEYMAAVHFVESLSETFGFVVFSGFAFSTMLLCIGVYQLLFLCMPMLYVINEVIWTLEILGILAAYAMSGTKIYSTAQLPIDYLHSINMSCLDDRCINQLLVYMSRAKSPVGISAWGFFTISKSLILTLVSVFISYFVLLFDLNSAQSCKAFESNGMETNQTRIPS